MCLNELHEGKLEFGEKPFHSFSEVFGHEKHLQDAVEVTCCPFVLQAVVLCSCREQIVNSEAKLFNCLHSVIEISSSYLDRTAFCRKDVDVDPLLHRQLQSNS